MRVERVAFAPCRRRLWYAPALCLPSVVSYSERKKAKGETCVKKVRSEKGAMMEIIRVLTFCSERKRENDGRGMWMRADAPPQERERQRREERKMAEERRASTLL
jgi:hypothetical protein